MSLPALYSGLAIPIFYELAETEIENSRKITSELTPLIINESIQSNISERKSQTIKTGHKTDQGKQLQKLSTRTDSSNEKQLVKISTEKGILNWLTMLPITEHGSEHQSSSSGIQFTIWLGNHKCFKVLSMWKQIRH